MRLMTAGLLAVTATLALAAGPATAQGYQDPGYGGYAPPPGARNDPIERRWADAQVRYRAETQRYQAERDRYQRSRGGGYGYAPPPPPPGGYDNGPGQGGYARAPLPGQSAYDDDRDENGYDAARYYRSGNYSERTLAPDDRVYAGSDGKYYCKRSDGTTGLVIGGAAGGVLGNVIDGGHSRAAGTLLGAALGALAGRAVDQQSSSVRCR